MSIDLQVDEITARRHMHQLAFVNAEYYHPHPANNESSFYIKQKGNNSICIDINLFLHFLFYLILFLVNDLGDCAFFLFLENPIP